MIGAIGAGMNQSAMLVRFARETNMDVFMLAGRYTLLDQEALDELLPLCIDRHIAVVGVGVMNSGILATPGGAATYSHRPADASCYCARQSSRQRANVMAFLFELPLSSSCSRIPPSHPWSPGFAQSRTLMTTLTR